MPEKLKEKVIVVTIMSPGVANDGGGFVIVNGKLIRIPPRSPALQKLVAVTQLLEQTEGIQGIEELKAVAEKTMVSAANELAI